MYAVFWAYWRMKCSILPRIELSLAAPVEIRKVAEATGHIWLVSAANPSWMFCWLKTLGPMMQSAVYSASNRKIYVLMPCR